MEMASSELENLKAKDQNELMDAFESAETVDEMLAVIKGMEESADAEKGAIGVAYSQVGSELYLEGDDNNREKVVTYLLKAMSYLDNCDDNIATAITLHLLGVVCGELEQWSECLGYLKRAESVLRKFEEKGEWEDKEDEGEVKQQMLEVQRALVKVKLQLGWKDDAIVNIMKFMDFPPSEEKPESAMEMASSELGNSKATKQQQLMDAFMSAETVGEMLTALKAMEEAEAEAEADVSKKAIGIGYFQVGYKLYQRDVANREEVMSYLLKALSILDECDTTKSSRILAFTLRLLGNVCGQLERWSESLGYLERSEAVLHKLEEEGECEVKHLMLEVQRELVKVNLNLAREEDATENIRKIVEVQKSLGEDNEKAGDDNHDLAKACVESLRFEEALPCCLKALEVHELQCGSKSVEVARDRLLLGVICTGLGEKEKASEQHQLLREVLRDQGVTSELRKVVTNAAALYVKIGKGSEAVEMLKGVVSLTDGNTMDRAMIYIAMAQALGNPQGFTAKALGDQKKLADTIKGYLKKACRILGKLEGCSPLEVCRAYKEISSVYQDMDDFETAMCFTKKAMVLLEKLPEEKQYLGILTGRMGWLLRLADKNELSISCYGEALEILKETFGEMHFQVASVYCNMGAAYENLGRTESAAQYYSMTQDILDATFGPNHMLSIQNRESLSKTYSAMGNYDIAIKLQEKNVECWKAHCPSRKWEYQDAQYTLEQLKNKSLFEAAMKGAPISFN